MKQEIINELISIGKNLDKSPGRRDIPIKLYKNCCIYFGSLNKAKQKTGLKIFRRKCNPLPKKAYKLTKNLVKIVSYLMFDGHLYKDLKGFYLSSKEIEPLKDFEKSVIDQFGIKPYYRFNTAGSHKQTHKIFVFNVKASKFLNKIGVPKGDKVITEYKIPSWIKNNKFFSREFLKIAFYCEGSKYKASKNTEVIKFNMYKESNLINNGLIFMNSFKHMLNSLGINTSRIFVYKGNFRKSDSKTSKELRIMIRSAYTNKFIREIGWFK